MQRQGLHVEPYAGARAERDTTFTARLAAAPVVTQALLADLVARHGGKRCRGHVLHHEPRRLRLGDDTLEFRYQVLGYGVPVVLDHVAELAERLARRPADHALELSRRRVEGLH